jgi:hypothetical protein
VTGAARCITHAVFALFLFAAIGKLMDLGHFLAALSDWRLWGPRAAPAVAFLVPTVELWLALAWFAGLHRDHILLGASALLCVFTAAYAAELALRGNPPECACLGVWEKHFSDLAAGRYVILRNSALIVLLASSGMLSSMQRPARVLQGQSVLS